MSQPVNPVPARAAVLIGIIVLMFAVLTMQFGSMTLLHEERFRKAAEGQRTRLIPVFAPRGVIFDRNMEPLVTNRPANTLFVRYPYYKEPKVQQELADILEMDLTAIQDLIAAKLEMGEYFDPVLVRTDITPEQYAAVVERRPSLPGVEIQALPVRVYPQKDMAAHLVGYVNQISSDELESKAYKGYQGGEMVGRTGLEAFYESSLRGRLGIRQVEVNSHGQPLSEVLTVDPRPGNNVVLTLDAELQRVAERALEWNMWRLRNTRMIDGPWPNARAGAVVVMEVKTGAILAMSSRPAYDPNLFARGITAAELRELQDPVLTPELNRAIQSAYQPGSTWKMLTSAAALKAGVIGPHDRIFCSGVYDKAGNPRDWTPYGHGWVSTVGALQGSCDIYYYEMGYRMGIDALVAAASDFGFGSRTGIDLGAENPGLLPDRETRTEIWEKRNNDPWGVGHTVSASIGQIVQATPLQLARYVATLGNGGRMMKPYLVQRVIDAQGETVEEFMPQPTGVVSLSQDHLEVILEGMAAVDHPDGGTSDYAIHPLPGIPTGGKTGTAEYPPWDDYGFFVSLAPLNDPEIAIAVVIEQAGHGSSISAVARTIQAAYFGVELPERDPARVPVEFPDDPEGLRRKYSVIGNGN